MVTDIDGIMEEDYGYPHKSFHKKITSHLVEIQTSISSEETKEAMELYLCGGKIQLLVSHYAQLIPKITANTDTSKIQKVLNSESTIFNALKTLIQEIKEQKPSVEELNSYINELYVEIINIKNLLSDTANQNNSIDQMILKPVNFKARQEVMETQKSFDFNRAEKGRIYLNLFWKNHKNKIKAAAIWGSIAVGVIQCYQWIKVGAEADALEETSLSTPTQVYEIMKHSNALTFDFLPTVVYLHNWQKNISPEHRWDVFYDEKRKVITLHKKVNSEQCKSLVALKEISFDATTMKVNKMPLPVNYWTGSSSENWPQTTNTSLCALPENETSITMQFSTVKNELHRELKYQPKELRFLINQHKIAAGMHNTEILSKALNKKIDDLEQHLQKSK